eukprot:1151581-Pelagomonas_calceolata.AAC.11
MAVIVLCSQLKWEYTLKATLKHHSRSTRSTLEPFRYSVHIIAWIKQIRLATLDVTPWWAGQVSKLTCRGAN